MDTDEVESLLSNRMRNMETTDRDTIVKNFKSILDRCDLDSSVCVFFLEMANWNIQDAICHFYDHGGIALQDTSFPIEQQADPNWQAAIVSTAHLPAVELVLEHSPCPGEHVQPCTVINKTFVFRNCGLVPWPPTTQFIFRQGDPLTNNLVIDVGEVAAGAEHTIVLEIFTPEHKGTFQSVWQFKGDTAFFGDFIWNTLHVGEAEVTDITDQLERTHIPEASASQSWPNLRHAFPESAPRSIPNLPVDVTSVPPSTPCTPPEERME